MHTSHILVLSGSLRDASVNRQVAHLMASLAPDTAQVEVIDTLDALPFYNQDLDVADGPAAVAELRHRVGRSDGLVVVTPENNGTLSAVVKNAIDWLSRPRGAAAIDGVPTAIVAAGFSLYSVHEHAAHVLTIAGAQVLEDLTTRLKIADLAGAHPADAPHVVQALRGVLTGLVHASEESDAA